MWRLKGCPRCCGDQYFEPDTKEWACCLCGYRATNPILLPDAEDTIQRALRGAKHVEVLSLGVQCRRDTPQTFDSVLRARELDANQAAMEREYAAYRAALSRCATRPQQQKAHRKYRIFLERYGITSARWSRLRRRWREREAVTA